MSALFQRGEAKGEAKGRAEERVAMLQRRIEKKYPRARVGVAEITAWLSRCDDEDADWILDQAGEVSFADFKTSLETRLKLRGVL